MAAAPTAVAAGVPSGLVASVALATGVPLRPAVRTVGDGGGVNGGQVIGSTTGRGEIAKSRPYRVQQVLSTVYQAVGIDPAQMFPDGNGRPMYVLDQRDPVTELL